MSRRTDALDGMLMGAYVGLASSLERDALVEVDDPAYTRQLVSFAPAEMNGGAAQASNAHPVHFAPWAEDAPNQVRFFFIADREHGDVEVIFSGQLKPRRRGDVEEWPQPLAGEAVWMEPGDLVVTLGVIPSPA